MKFSDFSNEKYRLNSFSVRIKYQPTVPNFLDSSLANAGSVRYNPETDKIEILYNGEWIDGLYVGLQFDGTIFNGGFNSKCGINEMSVLTSNTSSTFTNSSLYFTNTGDNSQNIYICSKTPLSVDIENFKRIRVVGTVANHSIDTAYAYIGLLPTIPTSRDSFTNDCTFLLGSVKGSLNFDKTIDIPTILKGKKYIGIKGYNSEPNYQTKITITQIILLKD